MSPEDYVEKLYLICLGRPADKSGLQNWLQLMRATGDPACVLEGILKSSEYARRNIHGPQHACGPLIAESLARIKRQIRIVDVGAQSLGPGSHPYDGLLKIATPEIIGFDPLEKRLQERAEKEGLPSLKLLPYAIGDGSKHTLHVNDYDATSSLFPLNLELNRKFRFLDEHKTVEQIPVETHRLDDVLPEGPVDMLKLDVQGAELLVLRGAERVLTRTAVVHCETMFSPMYLGQPLFPEIEQFLTARQFALMDILVSHRYSYLTASGCESPDRLLWADAIFFRETGDFETKSVQALIAASVYGKLTLAEYLLDGTQSQNESSSC